MEGFKEEEQLTMDVDWFGVDREGHVGHFATNGSRLLPSKIAADKAGWKKVLAFFLALEVTESGAAPCPGLSGAQSWPNDERKAEYLHSFLAMAGSSFARP